MIGGVLIGLMLLILMVLAILFLLPLSLVIDTEKALFYVRWSVVLSVQLHADERGWNWAVRLFNRPMSLPTGGNQSSKNKTKPAKKKKGTHFFTMRRVGLLFKYLSQAVRIKQLKINWDTGDFVRNAQLYPLFSVASRGPVWLNINFMGQQELIIRLQTRLYRLMYAGLRVYFS